MKLALRLEVAASFHTLTLTNIPKRTLRELEILQGFSPP